MKQEFVFFSNTIEEYEPFIKSEVFYWPRSIAKNTQYQRDNKVDIVSEEVGDTVYIVAGANIKRNIKDLYLKDKINAFPMITHQGKVVQVYNHPVIGYRYTHGLNPDESFMLPFVFFEQLIKQETYLGRPFSKENIEELKQIIKLGEIIHTLITKEKIKFERAYFKDNQVFVQNGDPNKLFRLDAELTEFTYEEAQVSNRLTYREMPSKESLLKVIDMCEEFGLDGKLLIQNVRTWRGKEFVKVEIEEEIFKAVDGKLQEGVSTRLMLDDDHSDSLITDIKNKIKMACVFPRVNGGGVQVKLPKNQILYGPPGTGKTFTVVRKALEIVDPQLYEQLVESDADRSEWMEAYQRYTGTKQIQFCTFHQSYSYEDFVEGLRSDKDGRFVPTNGILKDICDRAKFDTLKIREDLKGGNNKVFRMNVQKYLWNDCIDGNYIKLDVANHIDYSSANSREDIAATLSEASEIGLKDKATQYLNRFINVASLGDYIFASIDGESIVGIGKIESEYYFDYNSTTRHTRKVKWIALWDEYEIGLPYDKRKIVEVPFVDEEQFYNLLLPEESFKDKNYVMIIDEINRGNISTIFGELITLIEEDKRLDEENELKVTLPYSREQFGIPSNLYILGTMNTADRSITIIDTALRRRFDFIEMLPDVSLLPVEIAGVNVQEMVQCMNERIEFLYDSDHTIGHAYFLGGLRSMDELITIMKNKIIPLLQEYFYDDWEKIELVLGGAATTENDEMNYFIRKKVVQPANVFKGSHGNEFDSKNKYLITPSPGKNALLNIYED